MSRLMDASIEKNRKREARFNKAERMLRRIRLKMYYYEDAVSDAKAGKLIDRCKARLKPRWEAQDANRAETHWMYACE